MNLNQAQKILLTEIDRYIDLKLTKEDFYNPYNRYLPEHLKEQLVNKRQRVLIETIEKFEKEAEIVFNDGGALWEYAAQMKEFNDYTLSIQANVSDNVMERMAEYEKQIGNAQRLKALEELTALYESPDFERYVLDKQFKDWSRYKSYRFRLKRNYYKTNNSPAENAKLLAEEMKHINKIEYAQYTEFLQRRAELWDELRRTGAGFSPEKMKELAERERNPLDNNSYKIGIVELGRINAELGIVKADAEKVFPEYYHIQTKQKDLVPERKSLEVRFNNVRELRVQAKEEILNETQKLVMEKSQDYANRSR